VSGIHPYRVAVPHEKITRLDLEYKLGAKGGGAPHESRRLCFACEISTFRCISLLVYDADAGVGSVVFPEGDSEAAEDVGNVYAGA
jgi:hypothetical protein